MPRSELKDTALLEKAELFQRLFEEVQDYAMILMDRDGYIINWNKGAEKIKQYKEAEIIGKHFSIFYFDNDLEANLPNRLLINAAETGREQHEGWRKRKDGSKFWANVTITAIHNDEKEVIGFGKVTRDLTEKKIAEDNLRQSEERYQQMIAEVEDYAIILLNAEGEIENWNAGAEKIKGYKAQEVIGKKFELFYTPEDRANNLPFKLLNEAKVSGKALQEGWRLRKDGTRFWGTIVITALHNKQGEVIGFSKVTRDLTHRKLADEKMEAYTAALENQNKELEQFAFVASHDLQEPLRKIQTFTELIQEHIHDKVFVETYFKKLDASAQRMAELIRSLLEYSRISKDDESAKMQELNLNEVFNNVREDLELLIRDKNAEVVSQSLPSIRGNGFQMRQLFYNLIGNSLKFSSEHPKIEILSTEVASDSIPEIQSGLAAGRYHHLIFRDNGIGFEPEYSSTIFSLFKRLHTRNQYAGTGIGLALCKKIVENHQGIIVAEGRPGEGATFHIYLPQGL